MINKHLSLFIFIALFATYSIRGQANFNHIATYPMDFDNTNNSIWIEPPPWLVNGGWKYYIFTTFHSVSHSFPAGIENINSNSLDFNTGFGYYDLASPQNWWYGYKSPSTLDTLHEQWKRNYQGIFSAHAITTPTEGNIIIGYAHGENKNEMIGSTYYKNTVYEYPKPGDPPCYSGKNPTTGIYEDCKDAYFAFLNVTWTENTYENLWGNAFYIDKGPCFWPSNGYISSDKMNHTSGGIRHPSSIVVGSEIYIFYLDASDMAMVTETGRKHGIKVGKVTIADAIDPQAYKVYFNGNWQPSLPSGCTAVNIESYFNVKGSKATNILGNSIHPTRFSVAKIKNTNYYLGVEAYINVTNQHFEIAFRLSQDLVNWSDRLYKVYESSSWNTGTMHYPIFLNKEGTSNTRIDAEDFFVIGGESSTKINRMRFSLNFIEEEIPYEPTFPDGPIFPNDLSYSGSEIMGDYIYTKSMSESNKSYNLANLDKSMMSDDDVKDQINLYPNPFRNKIKLNFNNLEYEKFELIIYDNYGVKVKQVNSIESQIVEISKNDLGSGLFNFCIINHLTGEIIWNEKVIALD